ncbi:hypothetical protein CcCBS67573_g04847 [Chytriomyces confervae]|uniref:Phosphatidate phosphatase APP1 catalytic domain-containing protein n=1 Tax=Chytriomyces confervae TaxID=246404 RepID=A0A507FC72_9FUNG|nr:hypothetical protein CcCBS67573_g04847 [Chytriomyces confervae]
MTTDTAPTVEESVAAVSLNDQAPVVTSQVVVTLFQTSSWWTDEVAVVADKPVEGDVAASADQVKEESAIATEPIVNAEPAAKTLNVHVRGWVHIHKKAGFRRNLLLGISKRILSPIRQDRSRLASQVFEERAGAFLDGGFTEQGVIRVAILGFKKRSVDRSNSELGLEAVEALVKDAQFDVTPLMNSSGIFDDVIRIPESVMDEWRKAAGTGEDYHMHQLEFIAYKKSGSQAGTHAFSVCTIVEETGFSIITDLDDTIKDSDVYRGPSAALNNALFTPSSSSIAGMSVLYNHFAADCAMAFHYVSASPFQLLDMINNFLIGDEFPSGSVTLRDVWNQASRKAYKDEVIKGLFTKYPKRKFILIGDAGEKDAEVYASVLKTYPDRVAKILIRSVDNDEAKIKIVHKALEGVAPNMYAVFSDPASLHSLSCEFKIED